MTTGVVIANVRTDFDTVIGSFGPGSHVVMDAPPVFVVATAITGPTASGGGSGLPSQWSQGANGDVAATVDDATKTPFTIEAFTGQSGDLLVVKDALGNVVFAFHPDGQIDGGDPAAGHWRFQRDSASTTLSSNFGANVFSEIDTLDDGTTRDAALDMRATADFGGSHQASVAFDAQINHDATSPRITFQWNTQVDADSNGNYAPLLIETTDAYMELIMQARVGQTIPILKLLDETGTAVFVVDPHGAWVSGTNVAPADSDLVNSNFAFWLDDTPGSTALRVKAKDSAGTVRTATIPLT